jgi:hypothetical protein
VFKKKKYRNRVWHKSKKSPKSTHTDLLLAENNALKAQIDLLKALNHSNAQLTVKEGNSSVTALVPSSQNLADNEMEMVLQPVSPALSQDSTPTLVAAASAPPHEMGEGSHSASAYPLMIVPLRTQGPSISVGAVGC